jgi:hypothetical protein
MNSKPVKKAKRLNAVKPLAKLSAPTVLFQTKPLTKLV